MTTIAEVKAMKTKALSESLKGLDSKDKRTKLHTIKILGETVGFGVKVDIEKKAIAALEKETQNKRRRIRNAAKKALVKIRSTKRISPNPLDMFDGGVGFTTKK